MFSFKNPNSWSVEEQYETLRVRFFSLLTAFLIFILLIVIVATVTDQYQPLAGPAPLFIAVIIISLILYFLTQRRYVSLFSNFIVFCLIAVAWIQPAAFPSLGLVTLTLIIAALFSGNLLYTLALASGVLRIIGLVISPSQLPQYADEATLNGLAAFFLILVLMVSSLLVRYFLLMLRRLALRASRSATLLEIVAEIADSFLTISDRNLLLNRIATSVVRKFGYEYAQVFFLDTEHTSLTLQAVAGEVSNLAFQPGDRISMMGNSTLARAAKTGDEVHQINIRALAGEFLIPDARTRLILPILDGANIIGVFDIQRTSEHSFSPADIQAIRVLLAQLGSALKNVQLQEMQNANTQENKRLFVESQTNLREIQRLNQELTRRAWDQYLSEEDRPTTVEVTEQGIQYEFDWTPQMIEAGRRRTAAYSKDLSVFAVPVVLRGEVLGVVEVEAHTDLQQRREALDIVQAVTQRLAISLDNARLFEEAQRSTLQEQQINMIASEFETATSVDELLQIALSELGASLGAQHGKIRLAQPQKNGQPNGSHEETSS